MTLSDIELDIYRRLDYADSPPSSVKARIDGFINQRHRQLLASDRLRSLRSASTTLTTTPNVGSYGLPYGCARITRVMDQVNEYRLGARTFDWLREVQPKPSNITGTPEVWCPVGFCPVQQRPFTATALWISSPSAEAGPIDLTYVTGAGQSVAVVIPALLAATPYQIPGAASATDLIEFSSRVLAVGTITLSDAATLGNVISQIAPGTTTARYYRFALYPVPAAAQQYLIDYEHEIPVLVNPLDEPLLPIDFHDLIALWARLDEYEFKSDDRWLVTKSLVEDRQKDLRAWVDNHDIYRAHAIPTAPTTSRLGPFFPAGS
jgi:hypothetical protein